jgi:hypothetical protein
LITECVKNIITVRMKYLRDLFCTWIYWQLSITEFNTLPIRLISAGPLNWTNTRMHCYSNQTDITQLLDQQKQNGSNIK